MLENLWYLVRRIGPKSSKLSISEFLLYILVRDPYSSNQVVTPLGHSYLIFRYSIPASSFFPFFQKGCKLHRIEGPTHRQTDRQTGPILLPRPLTREVITCNRTSDIVDFYLRPILGLYPTD